MKKQDVIKRFKNFINNVLSKKMICIVCVCICLILISVCCYINREKKSCDDDKKIVDLSWYVNYSWFNPSWGENMVSKEITDKTGVNIKFKTPRGDNTKKLASMISSDTLPDIVTIGYWETQAKEMLNDKLMYPLDLLSKQYDPYFMEVANPEVMEWYKSEDGHVYQYPNYVYTPSDYKDKDIKIPSNETFLVRKDIYEAIGKPDMTTPDGFVNAVRKANEMFKDKCDLIPVGAHEFTQLGCDSFDQYLFDFLAIPYVDKDGNCIDRYADKSYIAWLKAFRKLGSEGLLKDDIFFDKRVQMEEKIAKGRYFCMLFQRTDLENQQKILYNDSPDSIYIAIDGPKNLNGDDYKLSGPGMSGWTVSFISKKCKDPEKAIKLFSYLLSDEGQKLTYYGVEHKMWDYDENNIPKLHNDVQTLLDNDRGEYGAKYGADATYWMLQNDALFSKYKKSSDPILYQMEEWTYPYVNYTDQYVVTLDGTTKIGQEQNKIALLWGETLPKLLVAKSESEFDQIYNDYTKKKKEYGYDEVLKESSRIIKENNERLGIDGN